MFTFFKKTRFFKAALFALLVPVLLTGLLLGCEEPREENPSLDGTWASEFGETFTIDLTAKTYSNPADGEWGDYSLNGNIKEIITFNSSGTAGIIYIEITFKGDDFLTDGIGNFTGVHFTNLTNTTVEFSNPSVGEYPNSKTPTTSTLADAKNKFTVDKVGDYFGMGSACKKQ